MHTTISAEELHAVAARLVNPGDFNPSHHFYPRVLNAHIHPLVAFFLRLGRDRLVGRYCHLNPQVQPDILHEVLRTAPNCFRWAGADLFYTATSGGVRRMVVIETNSCPSGNKSMPLLNEEDELGGFSTVIHQAFLPLLQRRRLPTGKLAVIFDKNEMEASGYAAAIASLTGESVYLASFAANDETRPARFSDGVLHVRTDAGDWEPIRAAFRYVTQQPWDRIPVSTRTAVLNPVLACLAGGRNKLIASKAYEFLNAELAGTGLQIRAPATIRDVTKEEVPLWVNRFGGHAVVKNPYSNAGQGVYTITSTAELNQFMECDHPYDRFVVQALIGNADWSSTGQEGSRFYHIGTVPDRRGDIYVADLRMMVAAGPGGFQPVAVYARQAARPLSRKLEGQDSWPMLGTNLSIKAKGGWVADTDRLVLMDRKDFNKLGLGPDDLIEAYIQTVLSVTAIDRMATRLTTKRGTLRTKLFRSLNDDPALIRDLM